MQTLRLLIVTLLALAFAGHGTLRAALPPPGPGICTAPDAGSPDAAHGGHDCLTCAPAAALPHPGAEPRLRSASPAPFLATAALSPAHRPAPPPAARGPPAFA